MALILAAILSLLLSFPALAAEKPIPVKVVVVTMFERRIAKLEAEA